MNKQELITEVKKMDSKDFLSQPLVLEILEQLDEPPANPCEDCRIVEEALKLSKAMTSLLDMNGLLE